VYRPSDLLCLLLITYQPTKTRSTRVEHSDRYIDLAFSTRPLLAYITIANQFDTTSDYYSLLTTVCWDSRIKEPVRRLRFDTLDLAIFKNALQTSLGRLSALKDAPDAADLDSEALQLTQSLQDVYSEAAKRTIGCNTGQPWWDSDCKVAADVNRKDYTLESARNLRNTVRKAKNKY
jgi:hypothetical protein